MKAVPYISVRALKYVFGTRYRLAAFTRKSKVFNKIVGKKLFDGDDMVVLPKDKVVSRTIETNIEMKIPVTPPYFRAMWSRTS